MTSEQIPGFCILSPDVPEISEASANVKHVFQPGVKFQRPKQEKGARKGGQREDQGSLELGHVSVKAHKASSKLPPEPPL